MDNPPVPAGFLEYGDPADTNRITRLVLVCMHPEAHTRHRRWATENTRLAATKEKTLDLSLIYVLDTSKYPTVKSGRGYVHYASSGVIVPI
ncbi:hypothetical protein HBH70_151500 [Parastagonospora nodorum]|nr:hypothetical protein HBH53_167430 [Parastagonospora nodorum]KAH3965262.1 hypothetical protein HBH51_150810 [Parastagonospora nodorum]KAH4000036.1 hypothetical protein HBI10_110680 [Parastagonospora nodorum]KAH4022130.1 hypothetical protein HBI13_098540 [Parastagonospora nodorum]KAH4027869.1 hypothetical protein HBI09_144310 [Parastagonospora nodorum]